MDQWWWRQAQKARAKSALLMFLSGRSDATSCEKLRGSEWDIKNIWERDVWNRFCKLSWLSKQRCASKSQAQLLWSAFLGWREGCLIRGAEALPSLRVGRSFRFEDLKLLSLSKKIKVGKFPDNVRVVVHLRPWNRFFTYLKINSIKSVLLPFKRVRNFAKNYICRGRGRGNRSIRLCIYIILFWDEQEKSG